MQERTNGTKRVLHPAGGVMTLRYDVPAVQDGSEQRLSVITPADTHAENVLRSLRFPQELSASGHAAGKLVLRP